MIRSSGHSSLDVIATHNAGKFQRWLDIWERPWWSALLALIVYTAVASTYGPIWSESEYAYFNYLADALLHGQLHLRVLPPSTHDLSLFNDRFFLYWPPFPAVLLLPFVALWGTQFSDVAFTIGLGALNVALIAILLRAATNHGIVVLSTTQRSLLVLMFAFGTTHVTLAPYGRVWYTGQLIGVGCVALAYLATINVQSGWSFLITGTALACALLTRNHLVLAGVWPACYLLVRYWPAGWQRLLGYSIAGLLPIVLAVALLGVYNWLRFGNLLDNGLEYHQMAGLFEQDYQQYGAFNLHYLPNNVFYEFIAYPLPIRPMTPFGGSLFLLTPVFFGAFCGLRAQPRWSVCALVVTVLLVATPILLLMGTGWKQFGPRYTLDFTVPLLLLTALGIRRWPIWLVGLLTAVSVAHYLFGAVYLGSVI